MAGEPSEKLIPVKPNVGDTIQLLTPIRDEYPPPGLPAGLKGTVNWVGQWESCVTRQIGVNWENGRRLIILADIDSYMVLS